MLRLFQDGTFDATGWAVDEAFLARSFASDFAGTAVSLEGGVSAIDLPAPRPLVVVTHPLENTLNENVVPERLALAIGDAEMQGLAGGDRGISFADSFNLIRRPGWVAAEVFKLA